MAASTVKTGLLCPRCGSGEHTVTDSRDHSDGIRRRRRCLTCGGKWSTLELAAVRSKGHGMRVRPFTADGAFTDEAIGALKAVQRAAGDIQALMDRLGADHGDR